MTTKNLLGGAIINYGDEVPLPSSGVPDGALFLKTGSSVGPDGAAGPGLFVFGFVQDGTPGSFGDQPTQQWIRIVKYGDLDAATLGGVPAINYFRNDLTGLNTSSGLPLTGYWTDGSPRPTIRYTEYGAGAPGYPDSGTGGGATWSFVGGTSHGLNPSSYGRAFDLNRTGIPSGGDVWLRTYNTTTGDPLAWGKIWTSQNDGAGSGLDADLLDGQSGAHYLDLSNSTGTLPVSKGGTGTTSVTTGGIAYGASASAMGFSSAGSASSGSGTAQVWQVLTANGTSAPVWVNSTSLNVSYATTANFASSASTATSASSVPWSGVTSTPTTVAGYGISDINSYAPTLTGGGASGTWGINISGSAASASSAAQLTNSRSFSIAGGATAAAVSFNGTSNVVLTVTDLNADNLSAGSVPSARLSGTYGISITGSANSASTASTATLASTVTVTPSTASGSYPVVWASSNSLYSTAGSFTFTPSTGQLNVGSLVSAGNVTAFSDARLKSDVQTLSRALSTVQQLRGVSFKWHDGSRGIGVIAQEVAEVVPEVVQKNDDGIHSVAYGNLVAVLIEAVKEQQKQIDSLTAAVVNLERLARKYMD